MQLRANRPKTWSRSSTIWMDSYNLHKFLRRMTRDWQRPMQIGRNIPGGFWVATVFGIHQFADGFMDKSKCLIAKTTEYTKRACDCLEKLLAFFSFAEEWDKAKCLLSPKNANLALWVVTCQETWAWCLLRGKSIEKYEHGSRWTQSRRNGCLGWDWLWPHAEPNMLSYLFTATAALH